MESWLSLYASKNLCPQIERSLINYEMIIICFPKLEIIKLTYSFNNSKKIHKLIRNSVLKL